MALNGEAIYSTRPWKISGGPTKSSGGSLYGVRRRDSLPAMCGLPSGRRSLCDRAGLAEDRKLTIKALAANSPHYRGEIARIGLLGRSPPSSGRGTRPE